jgi:hypothetical protein
MKKFLSFAFSKMPLAMRSTPAGSVHRDEAVGGWVEDYMTAASDMDAIWYYERRRWRA